jgi:hypothetical protein
MYANGFIIITNGKPLWVPVTLKEYNEAQIMDAEKKIKETDDNDFGYYFLIEKIKEETAEFSEKELNSPCYFGNRIGGCPESVEHAQAIVKLNTKYFDKTKPRTAAQLFTVEYSGINQSGEESESHYYKDEYTSFQSLKMNAIIENFRFSEWKKLFD